MRVQFDPNNLHLMRSPINALGVRYLAQFSSGKAICPSIRDWLLPQITRTNSGDLAKVSTWNVPLIGGHKPMKYTGAVIFNTHSSTMVECRRSIHVDGAKTNVRDNVDNDPAQWSLAPGVLKTNLSNVKYDVMSYVHNGAWSGKLQTATGTDVTLDYPEVINSDQIYKTPMATLEEGTATYQLNPWLPSTAYTAGQNVSNGGNVYKCITSGTSAGSGGPTTTSSDITDNTAHWKYIYAKPTRNINPANPAVKDSQGRTTWYNARQNFPVTPDNVIKTIMNQQARCGHNGVELGLGEDNLLMMVPYSTQESYRLLVEVMKELVGSGAVGFAPIKSPDGTVTYFSNQPNTAYGRATVLPVHGQRTDMWCVVSPAPSGDDNMKPFVYMTGGPPGQWQLNPNAYPINGQSPIPHQATYFISDAEAVSMLGIPGVWNPGDTGLYVLQAEGFCTQTGLLIDYNFNGDAS